MCETRDNCIGRLFYWGQTLIYFYHILWNHKVDKINKHCDAQFLDPRWQQWQVPETISWVWGHTNYLNFIQSLAIKVKWAPLHHHSDPFELIDRALIIIIILLWLCIKHHRTTCTSGGPQRRVAGDNAGERSHQHSQYSDHLQIFTLHYHGGHSRRRQNIFKEIQWFHHKQKKSMF